ncbi:hypothetical protein [Arthrobacter sp. AET 35A]|uniref:hypothetical protein n=1 Tax=Arthrobacter sp. AET 35A TaxID=2292643 RepID=UPI001781356A|nr:hypothetical protein [Arthrobacter sp. AET 35A]
MNKTFEFNGIYVRYKFREARQDRQHLVVVFAPAQPGEHNFYGFDGDVLTHVRGAILWIMDSFEENTAYYLCKDLKFDIERAVAALIDHILDEQKLLGSQCTLLGGSKGGSAALALSLNNSYKNVIALVPQTQIGTYTRFKLRSTFAYMAGCEDPSAEDALNSYIPNLVLAPSSFEKNIYIISSKLDPEFKTHVEPVLPALSAYSNFNLVLSDTALIRAHPDVTPYNVPVILSLLYALCEGIEPRFGTVSNGAAKRDNDRAVKYFEGKAFDQQVAEFHWLTLKDSHLNFAAFGAVLGEEASDRPLAEPELVLTNGLTVNRIQLQSKEDKALNSKLYRGHFREYLWAGIIPRSADGIGLGDLSAGTYMLEVEFNTVSGRHRGPLTNKRVKHLTSYAGGWMYQITADGNKTLISKKSISTLPLSGQIFTLDESYVSGSRLYLEGSFAVGQEEMRSWSDGAYFLTITGPTSITFPLAATRRRPNVSRLPIDFSDACYEWAYFSTPRHDGIEIKNMSPGDYECVISYVRQDRVFIAPPRWNLVIDDEGDCVWFG